MLVHHSALFVIRSRCWQSNFIANCVRNLWWGSDLHCYNCNDL